MRATGELHLFSYDGRALGGAAPKLPEGALRPQLVSRAALTLAPDCVAVLSRAVPLGTAVAVAMKGVVPFQAVNASLGSEIACTRSFRPTSRIGSSRTEGQSYLLSAVCWAAAGLSRPSARNMCLIPRIA